MTCVAYETFWFVPGRAWCSAKLNNVHDIQTSCICFEINCFLQSAHGASIGGGVEDATQLLESSFGKQEGCAAFHNFNTQPDPFMALTQERKVHTFLAG